MNSNNLNEQIEKARKKYNGCFIAFAASLVLGIFIFWLRFRLQAIEVESSDGVTQSEALEIIRRHSNELFWIVVPFVIVMFFSVVIGIKSALEWARLEKLQKQLSYSEIQSGTPSRPDSVQQLETTSQTESSPQSETTPNTDSALQSETSTQPEIAKQPMDSRTAPSDLDSENDCSSQIINNNEEDTPQEDVPRNPNAPSEGIVNGEKEGQVDFNPDSDVLSRQDVDNMFQVLSEFKQKYIYGFAYHWLLQNGNLPGISQAAFCRFLANNDVGVSPGTISNELGNAEIIAQSGNPEETKKKLSTKDNPNNSLVKVRDYKLMSEKLQAFIPKNKSIDISVPKNQGTKIKDC